MSKDAENFILSVDFKEKFENLQNEEFEDQEIIKPVKRNQSKDKIVDMSLEDEEEEEEEEEELKNKNERDLIVFTDEKKEYIAQNLKRFSSHSLQKIWEILRENKKDDELSEIEFDLDTIELEKARKIEKYIDRMINVEKKKKVKTTTSLEYIINEEVIIYYIIYFNISFLL